MEIIETGIKDLLVIVPKVFEDKRGYFFESYNKIKFKEKGLDYIFIQDNQSKSQYGTVRGLHYQIAPYTQAKLVRVIKGRIIDVAVDLRKGSPTFGKSFSIELNEENKKQLLVPEGFAHGFSVLSEIAEVSYKINKIYSPKHERSILYNDKNLKIDWKIDENDIIISKKDANSKRFNEAMKL